MCGRTQISSKTTAPCWTLRVRRWANDRCRPRRSLAETAHDGLDTLPSPNSRRNYAKALDDLFAFSAGRPLTRALVMEYRASIEALSACCIDPLNSHPLPYRKVDRKELVSMGNETLFA